MILIFRTENKVIDDQILKGEYIIDNVEEVQINENKEEFGNDADFNVHMGNFDKVIQRHALPDPGDPVICCEVSYRDIVNGKISTGRPFKIWTDSTVILLNDNNQIVRTVGI